MIEQFIIHLEPRCPPPEVPRFGGLRSSQPSYAVGEIARFKCAAGYTLVGDAEATCGEDGYFPYTETRCEGMNWHRRCILLMQLHIIDAKNSRGYVTGNLYAFSLPI